jgi:putative ABC transport system ATP-binding protein
MSDQRLDAAIRLSQLCKTYPLPSGEFAAVRGIDLQIERGELVAIVGKSGSGKSTLLNLIGGIDRPSSGSIQIGGQCVETLGQRRLAAWRGRTIGFVFQFFQLLPTLTALENVLLPMDFAGTLPASQRRDRALGLLERALVADQADKFPAQLSGGQQQRVAIARALANDPPILLADEPTGNLDSATSRQILELFSGLAAAGKTVVVVTHERSEGLGASRTVTLADGCLS